MQSLSVVKDLVRVIDFSMLALCLNRITIKHTNRVLNSINLKIEIKMSFWHALGFDYECLIFDQTIRFGKNFQSKKLNSVQCIRI